MLCNSSFSEFALRNEEGTAHPESPVPAERGSTFSRLWVWASTPLAVIGLASLAEDVVKWARSISYIVEHYKIVKTKSFLFIAPYLPFDFPDAWRDSAILCAVLFSVTSLGYYKKTGRSLLYALIMTPWVACVIAKRVLVALAQGALISASLFKKSARAEARILAKLAKDHFARDHGGLLVWLACVAIVSLVVLILMLSAALSFDYSLALYAFAFLAILFIAFAVIEAWRWILLTLLAFGLLVIVNEIYLSLLVPLGY